MSTNPWTSLPEDRPYVLPHDAKLVAECNRTTRPINRFELQILPEPFFGSPVAPIVTLGLNPGLNMKDYPVHEDPTFIGLSRRSLIHSLAPYPFLHLQPNDDWTPGAVWWRKICRELISDVGIEAVGKGLFHLQYFPYHSTALGQRPPHVPSQDYSFNLLRLAIERGAEIILMRSANLWFGAVPELASYPKLHVVVNRRRPFLSRGNLPGYEIIGRRLLSSP